MSPSDPEGATGFRLATSEELPQEMKASDKMNSKVGFMSGEYALQWGNQGWRMGANGSYFPGT